MIYCTPILPWVLGIRYWVCLAWYVIRSLVWSIYCWYVMIDLILWKTVGHMEEHTEENILETVKHPLLYFCQFQRKGERYLKLDIILLIITL